MSPTLEADRERLLDRFLRLVRVPSPTRCERGVADLVLAELRGLHAEPDEDDAGSKLGGNAGNIFARVPGTRADLPTLLFCAHMDTVPVTGEVRPVVDGDVIRSAGETILGADDKCGVAVLVEAVAALRQAGVPHASIELLFTVGEERGLDGAKAFDRSRLSADMGYALDHSNPATVVRGAPAKEELQFTVYGVPGHAARPAKTLNPIMAAARGIALMPQGQPDPESTTNVGVVCGGDAVNVVPASVQVRAEARSHNPDHLRFLVTQMQAAMRAGAEQTAGVIDGAYRTCSVVAEVTHLYDHYLVDESEEVVQRAFAAIRACGAAPSSLVGQGGQDANILNAAGVPTVAIGTGAHSPHTTEEHAQVDDMMRSVAMLCTLCAPG